MKSGTYEIFNTVDLFQMTLFKMLLENVPKRMKKQTTLRCTFLHQYSIFLIIPLHPAPIPLRVGFFLIPMMTNKRTPPFCQFFFGLFPTQRLFISCQSSRFCLIMIHTQVRQVRNQYTIVYTMNNHNLTWTSALNCLIDLLYFSKVLAHNNI